MPLIEIEEFKKIAEPNFYKPVFSSFSFLKDEYSFQIRGSAVSYETSIAYTYKDIDIIIFHAFPESPCLILKQTILGKISNERLIRKAYSPPAKKAVSKMKKARDTMDIETWCSMFRAGDFDSLIIEIMRDYAQLVSANIENILKGDFNLK
jgi:hypothetical protein